MTTRSVLLSYLFAIVCLTGSAHAEALRRYATVIDVQPIVETNYVLVTRRVCGQADREAHLARPLATTIGLDIRQQRAAWESQRSCTDVTEERPSEKIIAYRVTYRYRGHVQTTQLPYHPGERLPVNVTFSTQP